MIPGRETFPLSDLMKAAAIKSANDAAVQIAMFSATAARRHLSRR